MLLPHNEEWEEHRLCKSVILSSHHFCSRAALTNWNMNILKSPQLVVWSSPTKYLSATECLKVSSGQSTKVESALRGACRILTT